MEWGPTSKIFHYFSWESATKSKRKGGLGVKKLDVQNITLFRKKYWELVEGESPWARLMASKYLRTNFGAKTPTTTSKVWKQLGFMKLFITEGHAWKIGSGLRVNAWSDKWITDGASKFFTPP